MLVWVPRLKRKLFNLKLWWLFVRIRFLITGECGLNCGLTMFRTLEGTQVQQFVPEADCPIHDRQLKKMRFIGWIKANIEDAKRLKELGVSGSMIYDRARGIFEYCEITDAETMDKIEEEFPDFWRGSFSTIIN